MDVKCSNPCPWRKYFDRKHVTYTHEFGVHAYMNIRKSLFRTKSGIICEFRLIKYQMKIDLPHPAKSHRIVSIDRIH